MSVSHFSSDLSQAKQLWSQSARTAFCRLVRSHVPPVHAVVVRSRGTVVCWLQMGNPEPCWTLRCSHPVRSPRYRLVLDTGVSSTQTLLGPCRGCSSSSRARGTADAPRHPAPLRPPAAPSARPLCAATPRCGRHLSCGLPLHLGSPLRSVHANVTLSVADHQLDHGCATSCSCTGFVFHLSSLMRGTQNAKESCQRCSDHIVLLEASCPPARAGAACQAGG